MLPTQKAQMRNLEKLWDFFPAALVLAFGLALSCNEKAAAQLGNSITVIAPAGTKVEVMHTTNLTTINTNHASIMPPAAPMSVQMRKAAQEARNKAAPWTTRFQVLKVEERPVLQVGKGEDGVPDNTNHTITNWIVTLQPIPIDETNMPVVFGAVKSGLMKWRLEFPVKVGDKLDLAPSSL